jgi:hypothetical protein
VVEDGRFGCSGRSGVVMHRHSVQKLGARFLVEVLRSVFDQTQPEVDVTEQPALGCRPEGRRGSELGSSADVVQKRRCNEEVGAEAPVELHDLAADRCHGDCVLEQASGVPMMSGRRRGQAP